MCCGPVVNVLWVRLVVNAFVGAACRVVGAACRECWVFFLQQTCLLDVKIEPLLPSQTLITHSYASFFMAIC